MSKKTAVVLFIAILVLFGVGYVYRDSLSQYILAKGHELWWGKEEVNREDLRKVSTIVTYDVPDGEDTERYDLYIDDASVILDIEGTNVNAPEGAEQDHLNEFVHELLHEIKGKKLSEIEEVDKIGTSSLTTEAFNSALDDLKAQI